MKGVSGEGLWLELGDTDELIAISQGSATSLTDNTLIKTAVFV